MKNEADTRCRHIDRTKLRSVYGYRQVSILKDLENCDRVVKALL